MSDLNEIEVREFPPPVPANGAVAILPDALYSPDDVALILGFRGRSREGRLNRIYAISREELPRVLVGPRGGKHMFLGRDILEYIKNRRTKKESA